MKKFYLLMMILLSSSAFAQVCQIDMIRTFDNRILSSFHSSGDCSFAMRECRTQIRLRYLEGQAQCVRSGLHVPAPRESYVLGRGQDGSRNCYMADANGNAYGYPVDGIYCMRTYKLGRGQDGSRNCYMADAYGTAYGMPVSAHLCMRGYGIGRGQDGSRNCYMVDENWIPYGYPVSMYLCQGQ